jgi:putative PEP-CTERM system histidine kinase
VTTATFATATLWCYGLAAAGYLAFAARVSIGFRRSARATLLLAALLATAVWAVLCLPLGFGTSSLALIAEDTANAVRYGVWFAFLAHLLLGGHTATAQGAGLPTAGVHHATAHDAHHGTAQGADNSATPRRAIPRTVLIGAGTVLVASVLLGNGLRFNEMLGLGSRAGFALELGMAVFGLILVEQLVRRIQPQQRWSIKPLAVALAGVFAFDLFLYADAMLFAHLDADIWVARGFANVIVIPLIALATARNTGWTINLHVSRKAVFHSSALLLSGVFLLAIAAAGYLVRYSGGDWGRALEIELVFAAMLVIVLVATSGSFRSRLKVFISKHFFSYRYDYREEWLRFTRTLSTESPMHSLQQRTIVALADIVESPAGVLWLRDESRGFVPAARWNAPQIDGGERFDGALATFLARTGWVVSVHEARIDSRQYEGLQLPPWIDAFPSAWLVVPLASGDKLLGFVVLATPRTAMEVDWEVRDLLKAASRQAASYLGEIRATEALLEVGKFDAFNRMSAFVVHDLKNLVAQLSLMLKNAQRHRDNPQFQSDMLSTVENVVARMQRLMLQLRTEAEPVESPRHIDLHSLVRRVCSSRSGAAVTVEFESQGSGFTLGHEDRLEHVIGHLLQNAIDATAAGGCVRVRVDSRDRQTVITVSDEGVGMTAEFLRDRLFKPFQTTKATGMGIGVYESAQYVARLGGDIRIESTPGAGTRVYVSLPGIDAAVSGQAPHITEQVP